MGPGPKFSTCHGIPWHLEADILECEVKWALGNITMNKASGGDRILVEIFLKKGRCWIDFYLVQVSQKFLHKQGSFDSHEIYSVLFCFVFLILKSLILTCIPKHEPPSHLPPHNISVGHPHAPAPSMLYPASDIDWRFDSYMIVYMLQCHSPKSSHPLPLPLSPKVRYTHLCLFCCLPYRVVIAIFLNSIYMC